MDKKPMTAGEIAGRLAAKKIEPLVRLVEEATGKNLRLDAVKQPAKPREADGQTSEGSLHTGRLDDVCPHSLEAS